MRRHTKTLVLLALTSAALVVPARAAPTSSRSCGWQLQATANQANVAYPDEAAKYWAANLPIPPGGHVDIAGQYPHARYTSLITYTAQTQAIDGLNDQQIKPDARSGNPYLPHADRSAARRTYTVKIVAGQAPTSRRAPNTLYTTNADGSKTSGNLALFLLRIYVPDRGTGITGGVPLPSLSIVSSTGQKATLPDCPLDVVPDTGANQTVAASGSPQQLPRIGALGRDPLRWHKYVNLATAVADNYTDNSLTGDSVEPAVTGLTAGRLPSGGAYENIDNKYVYAAVDRTYGQVLVLRAKAPTTPRTLGGTDVMGTGQLRYWSMCSESPQTTAFYGCVFDEQIPVDKHGDYTIVISAAAARPSNATLECGVAWIPAGPQAQGLLLMRNMLPTPGFKQAIQYVRVGHEQQDMGPYYPAATYYAGAQDYERTGCRRPA